MVVKALTPALTVMVVGRGPLVTKASDLGVVPIQVLVQTFPRMIGILSIALLEVATASAARCPQVAPLRKVRIMVLLQMAFASLLGIPLWIVAIYVDRIE